MALAGGALVLADAAAATALVASAFCWVASVAVDCAANSLFVYAIASAMSLVGAIAKTAAASAFSSSGNAFLTSRAACSTIFPFSWTRLWNSAYLSLTFATVLSIELRACVCLSTSSASSLFALASFSLWTYQKSPPTTRIIRSMTPPTAMPTMAPMLMCFFSSTAVRFPSAGKSATSPSATGEMLPVETDGAFGFIPLNFSFGPPDFPAFLAGPAFERYRLKSPSNDWYVG